MEPGSEWDSEESHLVCGPGELLEAVKEGDAAGVRHLLRRGAQAGPIEHGWTALHEVSSHPIPCCVTANLFCRLRWEAI